ncbi:MAG: hypothetical protein FWH03_06370 [Firmicutes bacterium]|nr:hypothetical protein [Bacillota bacterium]
MEKIPSDEEIKKTEEWYRNTFIDVFAIDLEVGNFICFFAGDEITRVSILGNELIVPANGILQTSHCDKQIVTLKKNKFICDNKPVVLVSCGESEYENDRHLSKLNKTIVRRDNIIINCANAERYIFSPDDIITIDKTKGIKPKQLKKAIDFEIIKKGWNYGKRKNTK